MSQRGTAGPSHGGHGELTSSPRQRGLALGLKVGFDRCVAATGLLLCAPVLVGLAIAVRGTMGAPVFFRQQRPGLHERPFTLFKFRTMRDAVDEHGVALPDDQRLTRLGAWLRATSLDELPQLWNVLAGDLSLVGPRPLLMQYLPRYTPEQARRHDMRPGITGWAAPADRAAHDQDCIAARFQTDASC